MDEQTYQETHAVSSSAVSSDVVNDVPANSSTNTQANLFSVPQTEEEMRHCNHCGFQAEDWPVRI